MAKYRGNNGQPVNDGVTLGACFLFRSALGKIGVTRVLFILSLTGLREPGIQIWLWCL